MKVKENKKNTWVLLLAGLLFSLLACGEVSAAETKQQARPDGETKEYQRTVKIDGEFLRSLVAKILIQDQEQALLEEDLMKWEGSVKNKIFTRKFVLAPKFACTGRMENKMESSYLVLESGEDMEFVVKYFNCLSVTEIDVYDNFEWNSEQCQMLSRFTGLEKLRIETKENGLSLKAVKKLTRLEELTLDVKDVTTLQQLQLPDQVKTLVLYTTQSDAYQELFASLQDSSVTELEIYMDQGEELTLDALANWTSLEKLNIYKGTLRIEHAERNWNLDRLEEMSFTADRQTDLRFAEELPSLEYVDIAITEALDAAPLFERQGLGMYLQVAREMAEFEDDRYPDNKVIEVGLEEYTSLEEEYLEY